jgi:hypothetical protein
VRNAKLLLRLRQAARPLRELAGSFLVARNQRHRDAECIREKAVRQEVQRVLDRAADKQRVIRGAEHERESAKAREQRLALAGQDVADQEETAGDQREARHDVEARRERRRRGDVVLDDSAQDL